jgi:hypothetical protein
MSAFENFIQIEFPKRPFISTDPPLETVLVRRGIGPRELQPLTLADNQVVAKVGGVVVGLNISALGGVNKLSFPVTTAASVWNINHPFNTTDVIMQVTDSSGFIIIPDTMQIVDQNNIQLNFAAPQAGVFRAIFF